MSLHLYGLGGCVIQRPVIWNNGWEKWKREFGIEEDEQLVIMLAVGKKKKKITVPLSHRLTNSKMIQFLK